MKKIKNICHTGLVVLGSLFFAPSVNAQTISSHFFGENAWMPDTIGNSSACTEPPCILNGKLHGQWKNIKSSHASVIRFGGIAADRNMPTNYQYIRMIDSIRAHGMEPIIQVPFCKYRYTAQQAANIVKYINITQGKKIKYWIIGNEPDLGYSYNSATQIAAYFKPFSSGMKNADPSILIIGPECAWFNQNIIDGLTTPNGLNDITGKDEFGRYYLDIISFHTYPFNGSQTRDQVISKLTAAGSLQDNLTYLNTRVAACNNAHNRAGTSILKTAITEANINWQNSAADNLYGVGANSFLGGQFVAEMMGIGMKNGLDFINIWSVAEGNTVTNNIGYIDPSSSTKKPSFYHFKLLADNFKGNYVNGITNQANVKSFGSKDGQQVSVLILNEDQANNYNYTVRLNTVGITGSNPLKINVDAGISNQYSDVVQNQSSVLLTFNQAGVLIKKCEYSLNGNAVANQPPTTTEYIATGIASDTNLGGNNFEMKVFPNPSLGKFTIQLNKENIGEKNFEIELVNLIGQVVYRKNSIFAKGKEEIELNDSFASGAYIVKVKEGDYIKTEKMILQR